MSARTRLMKRFIWVLDEFAESTVEFEPSKIYLETPPQPGRDRRRIELKIARFIPNPAPWLQKAIGIQANYNGVVYIREQHTPEVLTNLINDAIPVGYRVFARGKVYDVVEAELEMGEYRFLLNDNLEDTRRPSR